MSGDDTQIRVHIVRKPDRPGWVMRYLDPTTNRHVQKSARTSNKKEAQKLAAQWEADLKEGRYAAPSKTTWEQFRKRYTEEKLCELAEGTGVKVDGVFNQIEEIVNPEKLRDLTPDRISFFARKLREMGRSENTIASTLATLRAALNWAADVAGMLTKAPKIPRPQRATKSDVMRGRPITLEEAERMLEKVPAVLQGKQPNPPAAEVVESWRFLLQGLWWSGLRLGEAMILQWGDELGADFAVDVSGEFPMFRIKAEGEKGNKDRILAAAPEFGEMLETVPADARAGFVFNPIDAKGKRATQDVVCRTITAIGKAAKVVVDRKKKSDGREVVKFGSAHDYRRSFGERWSRIVMPPILMELMRHESIETTLKFYVRRDAESTARILKEACGKGEKGSVLGSVTQKQDGKADHAISSNPLP